MRCGSARSAASHAFDVGWPVGMNSVAADLAKNIGDWLDYDLADLLLFSPQVYERMIVLLNTDTWPLHVVTIVTGLAGATAIATGTVRLLRLAMVLTGIYWYAIAWFFFLTRYAEINWAAPWMAGVFIAQGTFLVVCGTSASLGRPLPLRARLTACGLVGIGVLAIPALALGSSVGWHGAEIFGIAPDPTAIATLGLVLPLDGRRRGVAMVIPLLWCLVTGVILHTLGVSTWWIAACLAPILALAAAGFSATDKDAARA